MSRAVYQRSGHFHTGYKKLVLQETAVCIGPNPHFFNFRKRSINSLINFPEGSFPDAGISALGPWISLGPLYLSYIALFFLTKFKFLSISYKAYHPLVSFVQPTP